MPNADLTPVSGYVQDINGPWQALDTLLDEIPDLRYPQSVGVYQRMRRDPKLKALLRAVGLLIQRATWAVDPAGASGRMVKIVTEDLGLSLQGADGAASGLRARGVLWSEHIRTALLDLVYGHMGFELDLAVVDGQVRLRGLMERLPQTIDYGGILVDDNGTLLGIRQKQRGKTPEKVIPADRLLWYSHEREGAAYQGTSLLREAYGPWLIKHEMWKVTATGMRRNAMGVWEVTAPPGATPQQIGEANRLASTIRGGEYAGIGLPAGYTATLRGMVGSAPDPLPFIQYLDNQMAQMVLAQFLDLGNTRSGSRALGSTFVDFFTLTVEALASEIAAQVTRQVSARLTDWNEGEAAPAPLITVSEVGANHEVTADAVNSLVASGVWTADTGLEDYTRKMWRVPARVGPRPAAVAPVKRLQPSENQALAAAAGDGGDSADDGDPERGTPDTRQVDQDWRDALAAVLLLWRRRRAAQTELLVAQVKRAVAARDVTALERLTVTADGGPVLAGQMATMAGTAARQAVAEAAAQGVTLTVPDLSGLLAGFEGRADVVDKLLTDGLVNAAVRAALLQYGPDADPVAVAAAVKTALDALSDVYLSDQLGSALTVAQNEGRGRVFDAAGRHLDYLTAVEILDRHICEPCAEVDGTQYPDWESARADYPNGQYRACKGGPRCRGHLVAVYGQQAA